MTFPTSKRKLRKPPVVTEMRIDFVKRTVKLGDQRIETRADVLVIPLLLKRVRPRD